MIEKFTAFDKTTGRILYSGTSTSPESIEDEAIGIVVGQAFDCKTHIYSNGQFDPIPPRPGEHHVFDYETHAWKVDAGSVRVRRDRLLAVSDWTQLPDVTLATKEAWALYRQELRDITEQVGWPENVIWPIAPA